MCGRKTKKGHSVSRRSLSPDRLYGKADLHIHSLASDGLNSPREILDYVEHETDLDVIAIADHDDVDGALEAREIWKGGGYSFEVIVGEEITTLSGHLLALDISSCIRMFQSLEQTIAQIKAQNGLVIVPHPLAWFSSGLRRWRIEDIMAQSTDVHFDGMETFNPSVAGRQVYAEAVALAGALHLAHVGGSDSHHLDTIATARTLFPGRSWAELRAAIDQRTTRSEGEFWELDAYTSIALPQAIRSLIILPGKRVKKMAGWFLADRGLLAADHDAPR
jgi:predicted metal-dependent phosphoesterase TrpH